MKAPRSSPDSAGRQYPTSSSKTQTPIASSSTLVQPRKKPLKDWSIARSLDEKNRFARVRESARREAVGIPTAAPNPLLLSRSSIGDAEEMNCILEGFKKEESRSILT